MSSSKFSLIVWYEREWWKMLYGKSNIVKIDYKVKFIWEKDVFGEMGCKNFWNYLIQHVEDDNQHY